MRRRSRSPASVSGGAIDIALVFPHQLFAPAAHPAIVAARDAAATAEPAARKGAKAEGRGGSAERGNAAWGVVAVEEHLFTNQYAFHRGKLVFQRAAMRFFMREAQDVHGAGGAFAYVNATEDACDVRKLIAALAEDASTRRASAPGLGALGGRRVARVHVCDVADDWLRRRLERSCTGHAVELRWHATPNFVTAPDEFTAYFERQRKTSKRPYFFANFYSWQRQRVGVLLNKDGGPVGGKWSFDAENRKKVPKGTPIPAVEAAPLATSDATFDTSGKVAAECLREAIEYVGANFAGEKAYGSVKPWEALLEARTPGQKDRAGSLRKNGSVAPFPFTRAGATAALADFVDGPRLKKFGDYEDAMVPAEPWLWHSLLSASINFGLLDPMDAVRAVERKHKEAPAHAPLAATEGYIRQVLGWREFVRAMYEVDGRRQRTCNSYGFTRRMPEAFWSGRSGIAPVDIVTKRVLQTAYAHHIERLMVLGCFFLLCEINPDDVFEWFSALFIDAFDWVMVPNVYGMSQGSDGGQMMTKPYVCGSNYLLKMGDWEKKAAVDIAGLLEGAVGKGAAGTRTWVDVWDGLFWRFLLTHRDRIKANPRLGMLVGTFDKMDPKRKKKLIDDAEWYLAALDRATPHAK